MSAGSVSREPGPRYPWIRLALFDKKLMVIVDYLMSNCRSNRLRIADYYC